ncbi:hypothetical protein BDP27DRAFT_1275742 [Rhodocollybia butyracea]|uniref:Cytochrome c oxidase subunit 8, mitochondrial n=1 Tax=Rhodocollybia butyracea TaxID=206335 RepID=A0A9P5TX57_9AGAR|nr:hypothetical protein BDP27DRAFT_1275742 [Rhodocollybia butyracea]
MVPSSSVVHVWKKHLPFNYLNKRAFTYKFVAFLGFGFALPWVAVGWIWYNHIAPDNVYAEFFHLQVPAWWLQEPISSSSYLRLQMTSRSNMKKKS